MDEKRRISQPKSHYSKWIVGLVAVLMFASLFALALFYHNCADKHGGTYILSYVFGIPHWKNNRETTPEIQEISDIPVGNLAAPEPEIPIWHPRVPVKSVPVAAGQCSIVPADAFRFDCYPETGATQQKCEARGCCWKPTTSRRTRLAAFQTSDHQAALGVPFCFYPNDFPGYVVASKTPNREGFAVRLTRNASSYYPGTVKTVDLQVSLETPQRLHIKIFDPNNRRYEVPYVNRLSPGPAVKNAMYNVQVAEVGQRFNIVVTRTSPHKNSTLLNTDGAFIFNDQFLQLSYYLPTNYIYGLGEHRNTLLHNTNWTRFTMWNRDQPPVENSNLYGSHPFYLALERTGDSHGFLLLNSNAMDVILQPAPAITWRTIGGILDFYLFLGPRPDNVIEQLTEVIGRTFMPPYWSLGFHLCKYGYNTANETLTVMNRVRNYNIPQDVQWNDIDYMDSYKDFTTGMTKFGNQEGLVKEVHSRGMRYVIITDPGISNTQPAGTYPPYDEGIKLGAFINDTTGKPLVGRVWPGNTVFPDFTNPVTHQYWTDQVRRFHSAVEFDGLWIDMNEISNFVTGSISGCPNDSPYENPPFVPAVNEGNLRARTICPSSVQHLSSHYNLHNLYGFTETMATNEALAAVRNKRPFVISRSTFTGQGHYGGHWSGDNDATYYDMWKTIPEILNMNMFGITMIGADICGFRGNTNEQLCQRWHQLGAFYTFARNHNDLHSMDQDPAAFGPALAASTRKVLETRYNLLPYLYTLIYRSARFGRTVLRPLFFEFPADTSTYGIDTQFMWGRSLLITPVLIENSTTVMGYFPKDRWYDFYTGTRQGSTGKYVNLDAPLDKLNLHVRGGGILPLQEPALTTTLSRKKNFQLLVALNETDGAFGELFWDDGDSLDKDGFNKGIYNLILFTAAKNAVKSNILHSGYQGDPLILNNITVFGIPKQPNSVVINSKTAAFKYNMASQVLYVLGFGVQLTQAFTLQWM